MQSFPALLKPKMLVIVQLSSLAIKIRNCSLHYWFSLFHVGLNPKRKIVARVNYCHSIIFNFIEFNLIFIRKCCSWVLRYCSDFHSMVWFSLWSSIFKNLDFQCSMPHLGIIITVVMHFSLYFSILFYEEKWLINKYSLLEKI